jgi:hypothetical protein
MCALTFNGYYNRDSLTGNVMSGSQNHLTFRPLDDAPGIEIVDRIERRRDRLHTPGPVSPTPAATDSFYFPVGKAIDVTTAEIILPRVVGVYVRDGTGTMVAEVEHLDSATLPAGTYTIELTTQMKTYLEVESAVEITADVTQTRIDFGDATSVRIGARSRHRQPAATITTPERPREMMSAIEALGSALKTTTAERSYPTLRGHPPEIQLGDQLAIPPAIDRPDTGVEIEIPPELDRIFVAAPLAYYLGADLVPASSPRLTTDLGFEYPLSSPQGFESTVERTLKQLFLLDCVTRTEGYYEVDLYERNGIEPHVDLDFEQLYDQPLAEQVASYLEIPFEVIEEYVPEWRLTTYVEPTPGSVEQLPFVIDDLAIVKTPEVNQARGSGAASPTPTIPDQQLTRNDGFVRSTAESSTADDVSYVDIEESDSLEQAWIGDRIPIGASKLTADAFRNRLDRDKAEGDISIRIVLNDSRMDEERDLVDEVYGDRDDLPFDVSVHRDLTVAEFREVLKAPTEFLHYIGHTERDGLECTDGKLDVGSLEETGVDAFLLNSCKSYKQGLNLIEAGSIGGIVTLNEVINDGAVQIGETIARLLNAGFPLRAALNIARGESILGGQYIVVGDGGMTVTQPASKTPTLLEIGRQDGEYVLDIKAFATDEVGIGSIFLPLMTNNELFFLNSGYTRQFRVSESTLTQFLNLANVPVKIDKDLYWSKSNTVLEDL